MANVQAPARKQTPWIIIGAIMIGLVGCSYIFGKYTGTLTNYSVPSPGNDPGLRTGNRFWASNLKKPKRFDFVVYQTHDEYNGDHLAVHRLCGLGGDVIHIKKGVLFVNGKNADKHLNLRKTYILSQEQYRTLAGKTTDSIAIFSQQGDSVLVSVETNTLKILRLDYSSHIPISKPDTSIEKVYHQPWTQNDFGPYTVPGGCYFLLGDNRNNSLDSRYTLPVSISKFRGTALGKK